MRHTFHFATLVVLIFLVLTAVSRPCSAQYPAGPLVRPHFRLFSPRGGPATYHGAGHLESPYQRPYVADPRNYNYVDPKWYGGFHYRQLYFVGLPTGDIGRTNGIFLTPW